MEGIDGLRPSSPLPGHSLRPGVPVPLNARLSLGLNAPTTPTRKDQPTTTIRLISNTIPSGADASHGTTPKLKPFKTSFDLVLGSPQPTKGAFHGVRDSYGRRIGGDSGRISISNGRRPRVIPEGFDDEDSDDDNGEEKDSQRVQAESIAMTEARVEDRAGAKQEEDKSKAEEERKQREREAVKRKLRLNRARRRSSVGVAGVRGRVSVGRGGVLRKFCPFMLPF